MISDVKLSVVERETLAMVVAGLTYRQMAKQAGVSYETVKTRLVRLRKKTGTGNKTLLAVWALARKGSET